MNEELLRTYSKERRAVMKFPKLIYQTPKIFKYGGLYLKLGNKRYRIFKIGEY